MSRKVLYVAIFATAIAASILLGQTIPEDEFRWISRPYEPEIAGRSTIRLQSDLVEVPTVVLDSHQKADRQVERLIFITSLFDAKNQLLTGVEGVMDLRLKQAMLKRLSTQRLDAKLSIQAPAGTYRVRQVVQESVSGRLAAVNRTVEMH
jgi:hypothetical protein